MKKIEIDEVAKFKEDSFYLNFIHDSPNMRLILFCFEPGQELPVHSHDVDSEVFLFVMDGEGFFTGGDIDVPAKKGSLLISRVSDPHGIKAKTRMKVLVGIVPPI
ncbi:cupin domain-containing protein [archaeon]|nr:cupin domain-containing protein [archaeon]